MSIYIKSGSITDMQGPCTTGFHIPTIDEWTNLINAGIDLGAWTSTGGSDMSIYLKLPFAGDRLTVSGNIESQGTIGHYWSCSPGEVSGQQRAWTFYINSSIISAGGRTYRVYGYSIRPFKDTPVTPDSGWTALYSDKIYHSTTLGLISIKKGDTWITIADKNLGATTVWNSGNTLSQNNCGKYYQRGNNYGFAWTGSITTSSTQVNASNYGPGNYYSGSSFCTNNLDWSSVRNDNLRGGVTGPMSMKEVQNIYIGEVYSGPLRFRAEQANSTIQLNKTGSPTTVTLETSTDGSTWTTYTFGTTITLSNIGDKVSFRNTSETTTAFNIDYENRYSFTMTGSIAGSGDVTTLVNKNGTTTLVGTECFRRLFYNCTSLTSAPKLPATSLTNSCYNQMFFGCTSLTSAPELPATSLSDSCYNAMFFGCTSLTSVPELPANTMVNRCYYMMFRGCTALTTPPKLSSTALAVNCYNEMFSGCTSLEVLPELPATSLAYRCYYYMFYGCSKIKLSTTQTGEYQTAYRIPTTGTGSAGTESLSYMFYNTGGTFTSNPSINTTYYTSNTVV